MLSVLHIKEDKNLSVKLKVAVAVSQQVDFPLHLLVLGQSFLLFPMIIEEDGKVQVDQRVGTGTQENMELLSNTPRVRNSTFEGEHVEWTHSSIVTACSYALVAFSTSSKLVRATMKKDRGLSFTPLNSQAITS